MTDQMLRFYVDFNYCEAFDVVVVRTDININSSTQESSLSEGLRVMLYDESLECEATLRHGVQHKWVAELDRQSIRDIPESQWGRFDPLQP